MSTHAVETSRGPTGWIHRHRFRIVLWVAVVEGLIAWVTHGLHIGLGLAVRFEPEPSPTRMTVAVLGESDTRLGAAARRRAEQEFDWTVIRERFRMILEEAW